MLYWAVLVCMLDLFSMASKYVNMESLLLRYDIIMGPIALGTLLLLVWVLYWNLVMMV